MIHENGWEHLRILFVEKVWIYTM